MSLRVYKASAGSGKTYQMALEMVEILLDNPEAYKHSLAITFTNKAAGELKTRVIFVLYLLSKLSSEKGYLDAIQSKTRYTDHEIRDRAERALGMILHDYSRFSISTIDKFFNRVLSGFSYEANIRPDSEISLDHDINREEALDELLLDFDINDQLGKWLADYTRKKIDDNSNWNIRQSILDESSAIAQEDFLQKENLLKEISEDKQKLVDYRNLIYSIISKHTNAVKNFSLKAQSAMNNAGFSVSDFNYGKSGAVGFLLSLEKKLFCEPSKRALKALDDAESLLSKKNLSNDALLSLANNTMQPLIAEAITYMEAHEEEFNSAKIIAKTLNDFGVFLDLNTRLRQLCQQKHLYFPFQMSQLLHEIVVKENATFVYEKIGTRYLHYMLDEFQDTSRMQWDILKPLLEEGLAQEGKLLIVGDVKQSIYRWRNGDWSLLDHEVEKQLPEGESLSLSTNFRSRLNVVKFNNHLIRSVIPGFEMNLTHEIGEEYQEAYSFKSLYSDYRQTPHTTSNPQGFVQFSVLNSEEKNAWKETALDQMIAEMERLFEMGYSPGDMAILTRKNKSAGEIAMRLMEHDRSSKYSFPVVSASSLDLKEHPVIKLLLAAMKYISNPKDKIALNQLVFTYQCDVLKNDNFQPEISGYTPEDAEKALLDALPKSFTDNVVNLSSYPLFDLVENIIRWYGLNEIDGLYAYLTAFQDHVLAFSERNAADLSGFVQWFVKKNPSLDLPESADAIVISTLHKSKGLQYRFVFMPFLDWAIAPRVRTNLWLEPRVEPFNQLPLVMVNFEGNMKKSIFKYDYFDEYYKKQVDMLNMFYVAITRAEEGLWMWVPDSAPSKDGTMKSLDVILNYAMKQACNEPNDIDHFVENWTDLWNEENNVFQIGNIPPKVEEEIQDSNSLLLDDYSLNIRDNQLRYHHPNAFINLDQDEIIREKTNMGSIAHEVLENVFVKEDLQESTEAVVRSGRLDKNAGKSLMRKLKKALDNPLIQPWYDGEAKIITEHEIIKPNGLVLKPDRIVITDNEVLVIDYKFGKKHNSQYEKQVGEYVQALQEMGYENVKGFIWYVFLDSVVPVEQQTLSF